MNFEAKRKRSWGLKPQLSQSLRKKGKPH